MRKELLNHFMNSHESTGLLIAEAPTGYGKTYEAVQAIYQYVRDGGSSQILFVTNLLKNLPVDELRQAYERDGKGNLFEKEVLVLNSVSTTVEDAILAQDIPTEFQTDAYYTLLSACQKNIDINNRGTTPALSCLRF